MSGRSSGRTPPSFVHRSFRATRLKKMSLTMRHEALLGISWHRRSRKDQIILGLANVGLRMFCDACVCEWGCDNVRELMSFSVVCEKRSTLAWSAKHSAGVMYLQQRGLRGTLMIQPFSAGDCGQFYRNSSFSMRGRWPECPKLWFGLVWFGLSLTMLPHLPFYLSFICSFVSQYPLVCPVSRLILWSAVTSECQSEPLVLALILAVSVAAELLWIAERGGSGLRVRRRCYL